MYNNYFGFRESPFSIAPDPRYLYLSEMHQEALAHLQFGLQSDGGILLLTGEVGTGKTTLCRYFLEQLKPTANIALIMNPGLNASEILSTICDEFRVPTTSDPFDTNRYINSLNRFLLAAHSSNQQAMLIIDEAQNLDKESLEMLRLLANLKTDQEKLLQIILLGQTELTTVLNGPDLEEVNQCIIDRYHLLGLEENDTRAYVHHRISIAGGTPETLFNRKAIKRIHQLTEGVPRLINTLCDRALLGVFSEGKNVVDDNVVKKAAEELFGFSRIAKTIQIPIHSLATASIILILIIGIWVGSTSDQFYLNLSSILDSADTENEPGTTETTVEKIPDPTEEIRPQEVVGTDDVQSDDPAAEEAAADETENSNNILISPIQFPPEPQEEQKNRIVIKRIEIND